MSPAVQPIGAGVPPSSQKGWRPGVFGQSAPLLLVVLGVLFVATPFVQDLPDGDLVEATLLTLVMVFAVLAVGGRRRSLTLAIILVMMEAITGLFYMAVLMSRLISVYSSSPPKERGA